MIPGFFQKKKRLAITDSQTFFLSRLRCRNHKIKKKNLAITDSQVFFLIFRFVPRKRPKKNVWLSVIAKFFFSGQYFTMIKKESKPIPYDLGK